MPLEKREPIAVATLRVFVKILGGEVGNIALKMLATGGVYIGGGIPPHSAAVTAPRIPGVCGAWAFQRGFIAHSAARASKSPG
ncbi:MAG: glucokinase [Chloroflexota bacterium]